MIYFEAVLLVTPFLTKKNALAYAAQPTDHMLWVEENVMDPAGVHASINSAFGELVCEYIEFHLEAISRAN